MEGRKVPLPVVPRVLNHDVRAICDRCGDEQTVRKGEFWPAYCWNECDLPLVELGSYCQRCQCRPCRCDAEYDAMIDRQMEEKHGS